MKKEDLKDLKNKPTKELVDILSKLKSDKSKTHPIIGIALGGGASLGFSHIGVLEVLHKHKIVPTKVAGASMGAIIGAFYSYGVKPKQMEEMAKGIRVLKFLDVNLNGKGILNGRGVERSLIKLLPKNLTFNDLKYEFACNAVDLVTGEEVVLNSGSVLKSIRASASVPGFFSPVKINNKILVDGGILNNVPDNIVKDMGADIIISVNVVNSYKKDRPIKRMTDVVYYSTILGQIEIRKYKKSYSSIEIKPVLDDYKQFVFKPKKTTEIIEAGRVATNSIINDLLIKIISYYYK